MGAMVRYCKERASIFSFELSFFEQKGEIWRVKPGHKILCVLPYSKGKDL